MLAICRRAWQAPRVKKKALERRLVFRTGRKHIQTLKPNALLDHKASS